MYDPHNLLKDLLIRDDHRSLKNPYLHSFLEELRSSLAP